MALVLAAAVLASPLVGPAMAGGPDDNPDGGDGTAGQATVPGATITGLEARFSSPWWLSLAAAWVDPYVYLFGGQSTDGFHDDVWRYDPGADRLVRMDATLPAPRRGAGAAAVDGRVYVAGGTADGDVHDELLRYDPATDALVRVATLPEPNRCMAVVAADGAVYVLGGKGTGSSDFHDEIHRYDPATGDLTTMNATLPTARDYMGAVWTGERILLFGGDASGRIDEILAYDPALDAVETMGATLPSETFMTSAVWAGRYAYVFGGNAVDRGTLDTVLRYDPKADRLDAVTATLPTPRFFTAAVWTGAEAYVLGGSNREGPHVVRFEPPNEDPAAAFTLTAEPGRVAADASASTDPDGPLAVYRWDWGDGTVTETDAPTADHAYAEPGTYTVTLTVLDPQGGNATASRVVEVPAEPAVGAATLLAALAVGAGIVAVVAVVLWGRGR